MIKTTSLEKLIMEIQIKIKNNNVFKKGINIDKKKTNQRLK